MSPRSTARGAEEETIESVGGADAMEEVPERMSPPCGGNTRFQEVIKRRQVMLVQVVKEERGTKGRGAHHLSVARRPLFRADAQYRARGGGISRKITDSIDRKRLKEVAQDLEVPEGHGRDPAHRRREPHQDRDQGATSNICCGCGRPSATSR